MGLEAILGVLGGVGSALAGGLSAWSTWDTNQKNFDLQKNAYEWQKEQAALTQSREDNAVQRRVADLKAAGMSPILAAGSAASSSSPIHLNAPQYGGGEVANALSAMQGQRNIAQTNAQIMATEQLTEKNRAEAFLAKREAKIQEMQDRLSVEDGMPGGIEGMAMMRRMREVANTSASIANASAASAAADSAKWNLGKAQARNITLGNSEAANMADLFDYAKSGGASGLLLNLLLQASGGAVKNLLRK